jgi:hypothetical protein
MTQSTILAAADTAADSSNVTIVSGASVTLSLFSASSLPLSTSMAIFLTTPSGSSQVGSLSYSAPTVSIYSPGVYFVRRTAGSNPGANVGVSLDE